VIENGAACIGAQRDGALARFSNDVRERRFHEWRLEDLKRDIVLVICERVGQQHDSGARLRLRESELTEEGLLFLFADAHDGLLGLEVDRNNAAAEPRERAQPRWVGVATLGEVDLVARGERVESTSQ
jgi:hypothetical protein